MQYISLSSPRLCLKNKWLQGLTGLIELIPLQLQAAGQQDFGCKCPLCSAAFILAEASQLLHMANVKSSVKACESHKI